MHPELVPLAGDGFEGLAVGAVRRATFVVVDRPGGVELPRVSTAPVGRAVEGIAASDAPDACRVAVIAGSGLAVPVLAGDWLEPGQLVAVGHAGCAVPWREGAVVVGRSLSVAQPGRLAEVARSHG